VVASDVLEIVVEIDETELIVGEMGGGAVATSSRLAIMGVGGRLSCLQAAAATPSSLSSSYSGTIFDGERLSDLGAAAPSSLSSSYSGTVFKGERLLCFGFTETVDRVVRRLPVCGVGAWAWWAPAAVGVPRFVAARALGVARVLAWVLAMAPALSWSCLSAQSRSHSC
jgi:hypothetical protein